MVVPTLYQSKILIAMKIKYIIYCIKDHMLMFKKNCLSLLPPLLFRTVETLWFCTHCHGYHRCRHPFILPSSTPLQDGRNPVVLHTLSGLPPLPSSLLPPHLFRTVVTLWFSTHCHGYHRCRHPFTPPSSPSLQDGYNPMVLHTFSGLPPLPSPLHPSFLPISSGRS